MKKQNVLGLMLATTVALSALAGCKMPAMPSAGTSTGTKPVTQSPGTQPTGNQATSGQTGSKQVAPAPAAQSREGAAEALSDEKDMEAYDVMANDADAGRTVMMVGAEKPADGMVGITATATAEAETETEAGRGGKGGEAKAGARTKLRAELSLKLKERESKKAVKLKDRLEKLKGDRQKLQEKAKGGKWVDAGDGTEVKSFDFSVEKTVKAGDKTMTMSRSVTMKRVRDIETKDLISSHIAFSQTLPNGMVRKSERNKVLNTADGTYAVTFHSELTLKDGTKRVADWTKTIAVDGTVTGTGTITWTDAKGVVTKETKITLGGTEDDTAANTGAGTVDAEAPEAAEGTQAEAAATAATEVSGDDDATKAEDATGSDDDAEEGEEEGEEDTDGDDDATASDDDQEAEGDDDATDTEDDA